MMKPDEGTQDELLKRYDEVENDIKVKNLPIRKQLNFYIVLQTIVFGGFITVLTLFKGSVEYLTFPVIGSLTVICVLSGIIASFNYKLGFYMSAFFALCASAVVTYVNPSHHSYLILITDGTMLFVLANAFFYQGYAVGAIFIIVKVFVVHIFLKTDLSITETISMTLSSLIIGSLPILINRIAILSKESEKSEIRAKILALQNQELLYSWQKFYKGNDEFKTQNDEINEKYEGYVSVYGK